MLAPIDKISNPRGNDILQIVVTTACDLQCANCTQLLPFRRDYKFMSPECFEKAVKSVADWPGLVAMFGGNPCVHPQFPELCRIMRAHIAPEHRGLWSNNFFKHGDVVKETFGMGRGRFNQGGLNLNAHGKPEAAAAMEAVFPGAVIPSSRENPSKHAGILLDYRDFGISDQDWVGIREGCDINRNWSGAIVERNGEPYGYFCEVAASLDGIRGENSGVPAIPGWWEQGMQSFSHQVRNCCDRGCGVPLRHKGHLDTEEIYDVSSSFLQTIQAKVSQAKINIVEAELQSCTTTTDYTRR